MQKSCKQCGTNFEVTSDDLAFYEKASPVFSGKKYQIPPPTLCPDCRRQRRLAFRNERILYKRKCGVTGKEIISVYAPDNPHTVYEASAWWGEKWDPFSFGRDFDFSRSFFEQFQELYRAVPHLALINVQNENAEYVNQCGWSKNCYMAFMTDFSEDCLYTDLCINAKNCVDCLGMHDSELCYESVNCTKCYHLLYSRNCKNCSDCFFCSFCRGCTNCFGCMNLRNKEYYIFNESVSHEEWGRLIKELSLTKDSVMDFRGKSEKQRLQMPHPYTELTNCENCTGDYLTNSKNAEHCFEGKDVEDSKYLTLVPMTTKDCYDLSGGAGELSYDCSSVGPGQRNLFCGNCWDGVSDLLYCAFCTNSSAHLFGCVGLAHQSYCILNKQYSKKEYEELVSKIIAHMKETNEWGEFFPMTMSPFAYNETAALQHYPLSKEEAVAKGCRWREQEREVPDVKKVIPAGKLPASIEKIPDDILNWAITCEETKRPYRVVKQELEFYRKIQLPVPHLHPDERFRRRSAMKNPQKLWERNCAKCNKDIQTSYAPERPETVYCESCYLQEVY